MKKSVLSNFLLVVFFYTVGQQLPIGAWNSHFNYTSASLVLPAGDNILCASQNGLFFLHEPTQSVTILDKSKGFGDVGISALMYLEQQQLVIMGYRSGVVDLVWPDHIKTLRALAAIRQPLTKTIFDIVYWGNRLWLATGLGVAVIDLQSGEFRDVYREIGDNGSPIMARKLATRGDTIFVVSDQGLLAGSMTENLFDFTKWKKYPGSDSLGITDMAVYDDTLYLGSETYGLFTYQHASGTWEKSVFMGGSVRSLHAEEALYVLSGQQVYKYQEGAAAKLVNYTFVNARDLKVQNGVIWVADQADGLVRAAGGLQEKFAPIGPSSDAITRLRLVNDSVFVLYAPSPDQLGSSIPKGYSRYFGGSWKNEQNGRHISDVSGFMGQLYLADLAGHVTNAATGFTPTYFADNLQPVTSLLSVGDRLWATVFNSPNSLLWTEDGSDWQPVTSDRVGSRYPLDIRASLGKVLWVKKGKNENYGLSVYSPENGQVRWITTTDGLPVSQVQDMAIDWEDQAWICTEKGIRFFDDATFVFDTDNALEPYFDDGQLHADAGATRIAIDGGNRRWFGTTKGLFLYDPLLQHEIHHFTAENSFLPSSVIEGLLYQGSTGTLYVLTSQGLVSLRTNSSDPLPHHQQVIVFPNPIHTSSFSGEVGISGLAMNARVKITTVSGHVVAEVMANGSTASWDMRSYSGAKAGFGVYLVFSSSADGQETFVGKFVVLP